MSREAMYEAAAEKYKLAADLGYSPTGRIKAAVDAVLAAMERQDAMSYLQVVNPGDKFRYSLTVDEPGTYLVYGPIKEEE